MQSLFYDILIPVIDIILVGIMLYYVYKLVRGTAAINIFLGFVIIYIIWWLTDLVNMPILSNILGGFISVGVIALIVVFQQEIRKFLLLLGSSNFTNNKNIIKKFNLFFRITKKQTLMNIEELINACEIFKKNKTGALFVIERSNSLDFVRNTGDQLNLEISTPIIESIFFKNSPLHDGAVIIEGNFITGARVILPMSEKENIDSRLGLRHRAAFGITEKTDAIAIVVSEEKGKITFIKNGEIHPYQDIENLKTMIEVEMT
ncbi:MAG: TIGR00159 family protein [Flavobacteriaceae bacterium]|nr:TIGR00159 family protein [Flavobacteriaceae bacterium]MBT3754141.1 TIGR00159 family protein [Flavobacteriaceae bacterium]MBT3794248.1 TIGR00159 family protein [Flavobacteriaceae bacterium]MBT4063057.1 TIGR00159 family protein [Flavobacteriaceae bacterium]MBT4246727.1 TIGR00159 family protein [Flavobacteriaceae bacterium]